MFSLSGRLGFISRALRRVLGAKSARGVSFSLSILSMSSKPLGYLRTLLIAWAFGTSAGMDAYHLAVGIVSLFTHSIGNAMESAVLPELARIRNEDNGDGACESVFAFIALFVMALAALICGLILAAPGVLIRLFAGGFDAERIQMGTAMLRWLIPFALVCVCRPAVETWALFTERYTISSVTSVVFNFIAIPALLLLAPFIGEYAVAACMSLGYAFAFLLFLAAMRGLPLRFVRKQLPLQSLKRIGGNALFSAMLIAAGGLFVIVDRYFASLLPVGSVAAISYGSQIIGIISLAAYIPLTVFLAKTSALVAENPDEARSFVKQAISVALAFFLPTGFLVAAAAKPVISLTLGWGSFGAQSVSMTSICLSAYAIGMIFAVVSTVLFRYAQARQRLVAIVILTFILVAMNGLLDWLFVERWGLFGLACATSVVQLLSFLLYFKALMPDSLIRYLLEIKFFQQAAAVSVFAGAAWWCGHFGLSAQFCATAAIGALYFLFAERAGLMCALPEKWRPSGLLRYAAANARSFLAK